MENFNHLFSELDARIRAEGLLNKRPYFYIFNVVLVAGLMTIILWSFASTHIFWVQIANAALLAFVFGQIGILSHDLGHGQIASGRWYQFMNKCSSAILGWDFNWWVHKHNQHHAFPNQIGKDPDIEIVALAFCEEQAFYKKISGA